MAAPSPKSPLRLLQYLYEGSPFYDDRYLRYPVGREMSGPRAHLTGARRFNSSNQFSITWICVITSGPRSRP